MTTIAKYLSRVSASDAPRQDVKTQRAGAMPEQSDFANWLDLMAVICPGQISEACGFASAGGTALARSAEECT